MRFDGRYAIAEGMSAIPCGNFRMGSNDFYPEEAPVRRVEVAPFLIDIDPVTNAAFAAFVEASGYVTVAERIPTDCALCEVDPILLVPGSLVFDPLPGGVDLSDPASWWDYCPGASWRNPAGPGTTAHPDHPVVHVAHSDALAYAAWTNKALPTEIEWEYAARGGLDGMGYAWGDVLEPDDIIRANYWRGVFPYHGHRGTTPAGTYPPNAYGLHDMIGNVWEWTADIWTEPATQGCCMPDVAGATFVAKGGSHLCAENYCRRYRPAARQPLEATTSTAHVGFRCVRR